LVQRLRFEDGPLRIEESHWKSEEDLKDEFFRQDRQWQLSANSVLWKIVIELLTSHHSIAASETIMNGNTAEFNLN